MSAAPTGAASAAPSPEDLAALVRMGELAQGWLLDHTFGRCSCSITPGSCKGAALIDTIGRAFYAQHGRDRT